MTILHRYGLRHLLAAWASLFALAVAGQPNPATYAGPYREIFHTDNFDAPSPKWLVPQGKWEDGQLVISDRLNMLQPQTAISLSLDETRDFEIELTAAATSGLLPGQVHWGTFWWEIPAGRGSSVYLEGSHIKYFSDAASKNQFKKYTLRKWGNTIYYFVDEKPAGSTAYVRSTRNGQLSIGFSGKITVDRFSVCYLSKEAPVGGITVPDAETVRQNNSDAGVKRKEAARPGGRYFGLIIGVSQYNEPRYFLERPVKDAAQVRSILMDRYGFTDSTTILLLNPTRQKIISELYRLRKVIGPSDNLLIFYAGHGFWDKEARQGYWWGRDANRDDPSTWLSNSDLREQIRSIRSNHTLLVSDACFSGGIFRTRGVDDISNASKDIQILYKLPSRRAITSGTMTVVPDNSVFLEYFLKRLRDNQQKFMSSQQLFDSIRTAVINNSSVVPQDGVIAETGDEGGDFILILAEKDKAP